MERALIDTDTLSEVMKAQDDHVVHQAEAYLSQHRAFTFSIITRYEILRGLLAKQAWRKVQAFDERCGRSVILPLSDQIVNQAAEIYAHLYRAGQLISDADILIAATALVHGMTLISENSSHYERVPGLQVIGWRA